MKSVEFGAIQAAYFEAVNAHAKASAVLYQHVVDHTEPTATEIQRKEDARVMLEAARATYFAVLS